MYVCLCSAVTTDQIIKCVRSGSKDLDSVTKKLGVGLNCGSCIDMISDLIANTASQDCSRAVDSDRYESDDV